MVLSAGGAPLSILCLHGFSQSGSMLQQMMRRTLQECGSDSVRLTFVDAPLPTEQNAPHGRAWWRAAQLDSGSWEYHEVDKGLKVVNDADAAERATTGSGFDGLLGFSQGASLTSLLTALISERQRRCTDANAGEAPAALLLQDVRFAIFAGGFPFRAQNHPEFTSLLTPGALRLPSLHMIGEGDTIVKPGTSEQLVRCFDQCHVQIHPGKHVVPSDPESTAQMVAFLEAQARAKVERERRD
jgi:predicted esterase